MLPVKTDWMKEQMEHDATREYSESLYNIAKKFQPKTMLEIGCMWGVSALAFLTATEGHLTSVDLSEWTHAPEELKANGLLDRWRFINASSEQYWKTHDEKFDLVYIDGDHSYEYALNDISEGWQRISKGGVLVIDDVLHKYNGKTYGVSLAAWRLMQEHRPTNLDFEGKILYFVK